VGEIRKAVKNLLSLELPRGEMEFEDYTSFWKSRWLWCVNGAHSKTIGRVDKKYAIPDGSLGGMRLHRRVFAEQMKDEILTDWDGRSFFSGSDKLETGVSRAIYSGDTVTYLAFEHLLRPVERAWMGRRAILDPGVIGTYGMWRRLNRLRKKSQGIYLMLDYSDFNSCHSNEVMAAVIDEVCKHVGYPEDLAGRLVDSFHKAYLAEPGRGERPTGPVEVITEDKTRFYRMMGTLMSGHRATTFLNTLLNYAYIEVCYPPFKSMLSMHVGDDVLIMTSYYSEAFALLGACEDAELNMNPMKQSTGIYCAEFLRVSYKDEGARGYLMRSIGACIAGNWANDLKLDLEEGLRTIIGHSWTLTNRSQDRDFGKILISSLHRISGISKYHCRNLLKGTTTLAEGPSRQGLEPNWDLDLEFEKNVVFEKIDERASFYDSNATSDYLAEKASPLEVDILTRIEVSPVREMKRASYGKTLAGVLSNDFKPIKKTTVLDIQMRKYAKVVSVDEAWDSMNRDEEREKPVLAGYPILELVKSRISTPILREVVQKLTGELYTSLGELKRVAWGQSGWGAGIMGWLSYADASKLASWSLAYLVQVTGCAFYV
jgi:hypothetical protein